MRMLRRTLNLNDLIGRLLDSTSLRARSIAGSDRSHAKVKEFFPLESTADRLLRIYAELLDLEFVRNASLPRWHEDVVAFEVRRGGELVGHLYLDQFPRDGKFGHQMIVPLAPSFVDTATGLGFIRWCRLRAFDMLCLIHHRHFGSSHFGSRRARAW